MLKIPKQIYFDEPMLLAYEQHAKSVGKSFSAVIRETLELQVPAIKKFLLAAKKRRLNKG